MDAIETDRLTIRNFVEDDWVDLHKMIVQYQASECAAYDHKWPTSVEEIQGITDWFSQRDSHLVVCLRPAGTFVGLLVLNPEEGDEQPVFNLDYIFNFDYHGRGYATEGCRAILDRAFHARRRWIPT
jgi:RimJ/RimL family protein N-acetyltransferase